MGNKAAHFIFIFLDGVGLGDPNPGNPFARPDSTPFLNDLLGGPLTAGATVDLERLQLKPLDASLGVPGLPQSATGQTALFTGRNAPAFLGRHLTGFANGSLRTLIEEAGIFKQVLEKGGVPTHANLYSEGYFQAVEQRRIRYSVGTLVGLTSGVPFRMPEDYERGAAVAWDITGENLRARGVHAPHITPQEAGRRLAKLGAEHTLTLFECYLPDYAGHHQDMEQALRIIRLVDRFLESVVTNLPGDVTLVVSSDHGNIEDLSTKTHTYNPVPFLAVGPHAAAFRDIPDIMGITPKIIELMA